MDNNEKVNAELIDSEEYLAKHIPRKNVPEKRIALQIYHSLCQVLPCLDWIPNYRHNKRYLIGDVLGGVTVGLMVIPQSMSYAMLAGIDPVYGMYSCFVPLIVYSLFASSKQLAVAPEATDSGLKTSVAMGLDKALQQRLSSPPGQRTGQRRSDGSGRLRIRGKHG